MHAQKIGKATIPISVQICVKVWPMPTLVVMWGDRNAGLPNRNVSQILAPITVVFMVTQPLVVHLGFRDGMSSPKAPGVRAAPYISIQRHTSFLHQNSRDDFTTSFGGTQPSESGSRSRLVTCFLFFGPLGLPFVWNLCVLVSPSWDAGADRFKCLPPMKLTDIIPST